MTTTTSKTNTSPKKDETTDKDEPKSTKQTKSKTSKKNETTDKDTSKQQDTTETPETDETTDNEETETPDTKKKTRKGKIDFKKVDNIVKDITQNRGVKNKTLINKYGITSTSVSKIKKSLQRQWVKRTDETPLPERYYTGKSIDDFVITSQYDKGYIPID